MKTITDILIEAIEADERSYYRLAIDSGVSHPQLLRFVDRSRSLRLDSVDRLAAAMNLTLVSINPSTTNPP